MTPFEKKVLEEIEGGVMFWTRQALHDFFLDSPAEAVKSLRHLKLRANTLIELIEAGQIEEEE